MRRTFVAGLVVLLLGIGSSVSAVTFPELIELPGATSAEGVATGAGSTFYAGDLLAGDIFRGDLDTGDVALFIDAPEGRAALGLKADVANDLLFVAGGATGQAYVYDLTSGATVATYDLGVFINDVVVTKDAAWFTDTNQPHLYRVPIGRRGTLGAAETLVLSGPAADTSFDFNLNGIAASENGKTLIVAHSGLGALFTVDPDTGESALIAGVEVASVDGILLEGRRVYAVQNFLNQIAIVNLSADLSSGEVTDVITSPLFQVPTTVARYANRLVTVNAKFDTGFPPTADSYEVVQVRGS
jgi:hypothetical protein